MRVFDLYNFKSTERLSVALGTFDGIHLGHTAVIKSAVDDAAQKNGVKSAVLSVNRTFMGEERTPLRLVTESEKCKILTEMGVDYLINISLRQVKNITAEDFFRYIIIKKLQTVSVFCGFNCRFGKEALGDAELLAQLCSTHGVEFRSINPVMSEEKPVSSTRIRDALKGGYADLAEKLLGRPFSFDFEVIGGDKIGRKLGAPTINQVFPPDFIKPRQGVYAALANLDGKIYPAVCNIGIRPTVGGTTPRAETYIIGFSGDLYGKKIPVSLIKYIRPEIKFSDLERLKEAIKADASVAEKIFCSRKH